MIFGFEVVHGSGNIQTREFDFRNFRSIRMAGTGTLSVNQTGEESIRIETDDNLFDYLRVELRGDELFLGVVNNVNLRPTRRIQYSVTVRDVEAISLSGVGVINTSNLTAKRLKLEISGSGDLDTGALVVEEGCKIRISGSGEAEIPSIKAEEAELTISGSGKLRMDEVQAARVQLGITGAGDIRARKLETHSIESRISGSGDIELEGKTDEQALTISAAGKYKTENFESSRADIKISGSGSARVCVKERLDARISGSGSIHYRGKPIVVFSVSGSGKVKSMEN